MKRTTLALSLSVPLLLVACTEQTSAPPQDAPPSTPSSTPAAPPSKPLPFPEVKVPADNPMNDGKVALGRQLFFDARLSADGSRSCYSCHKNENGSGGAEPLAVGALNKALTRHSPTLWNVALYDSFYWEGRSPSLEAQAKAAWAGGNMGVGADKLDAKAKEIAAIKGYKEQFDQLFPGVGVTPDTIVAAIASYERTLLCKDTAYDRYMAGDATAMTDEQKRGLDLFNSKGQCVICHAPPTFSTAMVTPGGAYFNTGIGTVNVPEDKVDVGRYAVTKNDADWAAFKPPSLRNASRSAPYFHDGSVATLEEAVRFMAKGGHPNKNKSALLGDRGLDDGEIKAIVAFLGALDCQAMPEQASLPQ